MIINWSMECFVSHISGTDWPNWPVSLTSAFNIHHTCHKLWTRICEIRQNFKGDSINFCEIFLNITLELPKYSLKSFFHVRSLWKPQQCVIYVYFFIKSVVHFVNVLKILWDLNFLWELPSRWAKFCDLISQCEIWHVWFTWIHPLYVLGKTVRKSCVPCDIALDKILDMFLISPWKHMLWVLIRSTSARHFYWVPTTYTFVEKY